MKNKGIYIKIVLVILLVAIIIATIIFLKHHQRIKDNSIFQLQKITIYNGVKIDENDSENNFNVSHYSDLSFIVNNNIENSELTDSNTIKSLYIDNIHINSKNDIGTKTINYKNPLTLGKYSLIQNSFKERIDFKVIKTNNQDDNTNYDDPTFYTDCSNPISLGYLNKDILENYSMPDNTNKVFYNAKILKDADIGLEDLNNTLSFTIHIVNNSNHKFSCTINNLDLSLDDDFFENGYSYMSKSLTGDEYRFIRD